MESKANFLSYCNEVTKQLQIRYVPPSLPVDLKYVEDKPSIPTVVDIGEKREHTMESRQLEFQSLARAFK